MKPGFFVRLLGIVVLLLLPIGVSWWAIELLRYQQLSGCQSLKDTADQEDAAAAANFYCAQASATEQTVNGLSEGIRLASLVPNDHPLHAQRDQRIAEWSQKLLDLATQSFQDGDLDAAIDTARRIPATTAIYPEVDDRIKEWQSTWDNAQTIYSDAQAAANRESWPQAFEKARELLRLGNHYWGTDRYQELVKQIQAAKEGKTLQAKAERDRQPSPATKLAAATDPMADWQKEQAQEAAAYLSKARQLASAGTVDGLRAATDTAGQVLFGTPQYDEAQRLIERWNTQVQTIEDRPYLERAVRLASKGDAASLQAAIAEASNVSFGSALYQDAQTKIGQWTDKVQKLNLQAYPDQSMGGNGNRPAH